MHQEPNDTPAFTPEPVELAHGGELSLTEHDGDYQMRIDVDGGHFAIRLGALDVWALRSLTGDLVLARLNEISPSTQRFMELLDEHIAGDGS